jgi:hypothetical protein
MPIITELIETLPATAYILSLDGVKSFNGISFPSALKEFIVTDLI